VRRGNLGSSLETTSKEIEMASTDFISEARELDWRTADGIDVRLLWYPATDTVTVAVFDSTRQAGFELTVESDAALDAFRHPFAHAAYLGFPYDAPLRAHEQEIAA
jgi:hypothetical protein